MRSKKQLVEMANAATPLTEEESVQCEISAPLMGKAAIDAWNADKEIAPAVGLDDIFNNRIAEIEAEVPSISFTSELSEEYEGLDAQAVAIELTVKDIKQLLLSKNYAYGGSAFKDVILGGRLITAEDAILVRIADKIRRLTEGEEYGSEDSYSDLLGYLVLRAAVKKFKEKK